MYIIVTTVELQEINLIDFIFKNRFKVKTMIIINLLKMSDRIEQLKDIQMNALELFIKKNTDYADAFAKFGLMGVLMRIEDKIQRCLSISSSKIVLVNDEALEDTLLDLHNYAAMALMLKNN